MCRGRVWKTTSTGFGYQNRDATIFGMRTLKLRGGTGDHGQIVAKAAARSARRAARVAAGDGAAREPRRGRVLGGRLLDL
jgi:hypothetical protein